MNNTIVKQGNDFIVLKNKEGARQSKECMSAIERAKHDGAVRGLRERISRLMHSLCINNFDGICSNGNFIRLGDAINDAETLLRHMRDTLEALQELEPDNK